MIQFGSFHLGAKATGKPFSKAIVRAPVAKKIPDRKADHVVEEVTSPEQAALYRLSGDYNPLHIGMYSFLISLLLIYGSLLMLTSFLL
jgi:hypothetical protein